MYDAQRTNGARAPLWYEELAREDARTLEANTGMWPDAPTDLIVVGGGMAGLSVGYHACRRGKTVLVIERGELGSGETGRTTAHLSSALDDRYFHLERLHGERGAQLAAASHCAAINDIERIVQEESIACAFRRLPGYLFSSKSGRAGAKELARERAAAHRARLTVELERSPKVALADGPCLRFDRQADFEPLAYVAGLARAIVRMGGVVATRTRVTDIHVEHATPSVTVEDGRKFSSKALVIATNSPINDRLTMHTKQAAYRSYVVVLEIPEKSIEPALYWDTEDPYHYVRLTPRGDGLIVGGEDHRVGQSDPSDARFARLESWARDRFPQATKTVSRWSGQIQEPADGMAFIGKNPSTNAPVYIATGDSGNGITHGAIAGMLLNDLIDGRSNPWSSLYDPSRKLSAIRTRDFLMENAKTSLHFADWLLPRRRAESSIGPGEGRVVRRGLRQVAVYVDEAGRRHECSAKCPHLGCVVAWNALERSWDCPCHGSRFDPRGKVMTGPARADLAALDEEASSEVEPTPA
jgi:glycine/D-amino acid oxidase-like deaminating enzyme/nitrite reductase/ring-hydroxylating ferredoxin subunit